MVTSMLALNALLMLAVVVAVISLLLWAILTQHRDHESPSAPGEPRPQPAASRSRPATRARRGAVTGGA